MENKNIKVHLELNVDNHEIREFENKSELIDFLKINLYKGVWLLVTNEFLKESMSTYKMNEEIFITQNISFIINLVKNDAIDVSEFALHLYSSWSEAYSIAYANREGNEILEEKRFEKTCPNCNTSDNIVTRQMDFRLMYCGNCCVDFEMYSGKILSRYKNMSNG